MLFNSFSFAIFFPVVTILYFALPYGWRNGLLLVASCIFYCAAIPAFLLILWFTIVVDYFAGVLIESATGARRKHFLMLSLFANIGVLTVFKYGNFIWGNIAWLGSFMHWVPPFHVALMLPIGLSFHTFQAMSYTIEVYRGHQRAERHFWTYALYVMFYPQLVAGPIERPQHLLHQFREPHDFDADRVSQGLRRMLLGFCKKVFGDRIGVFVNTIYMTPDFQGAPALALAVSFFAAEIYLDFSGYTDIAIGAAQVMGFRLMENFNHPLMARSPSGFWKRWHISLTTWFRDYLYLPFGGRFGIRRQLTVVLLTFLLCGLWHGPNWTFLMWGMYYGLWSVIAHVIRRLRIHAVGPLPGRLRRALRVPRYLGTLIGVCAGGIFFRSQTLSQAFGILGKLLNPLFWIDTIGVWPPDGYDAYRFWVGLGAIILLIVVFESCQVHTSLPERFLAAPVWVRWLSYYAVIVVMLVFGEFGARPFTYFQF